MNEEIDNKITEEHTEDIPECIIKGYPSLELMNWFEQENDYNLLRCFDLNQDSLVVDIGCYNSTWLKDMYCKYNCNCIGVEPIREYYEQGSRILTNTSKIKLYNYGLTVNPDEKTCSMSMIADASSMFGDPSNMDQKKNPIDVQLVYAKDFFKSIKKDIDVLQINIEGYEYNLVPFLINNNILNTVKNIQIQFHNFFENSEEKMNIIINELEKLGFKKKFNYPFIWYGASR